MKKSLFITLIFFVARNNNILFPVVITFMCLITSCESLFDYDSPQIKLSTVEDITSNSAVLVASITTKDTPVELVFQYNENGEWKWFEYNELYGGFVTADSCPANQTNVIKKKVVNLKPGTTYKYRASAFEKYSDDDKTYAMHVASTKVKEFTTPVSSVLTIREMKSDFSNISVILDFIPHDENTKVQLECNIDGNIITKLSEAYSAPTEINFNLEGLEKNTIYPIKIKTLDKFNLQIDTSFNTCAVSDYDGNTYRVVTIGTQTWLQENFRGTHFTNGDPINLVDNKYHDDNWFLMQSYQTHAYCWYNHDAEIGKVYGGLYNWFAANDTYGRKLIEGYKTPGHYDFDKLANYLGGWEVAGAKMREAGYAHWRKPTAIILGEGYVQANTSGFCGLPGGHRREYGFANFGSQGQFWTSDRVEDNQHRGKWVYTISVLSGVNELIFYGGLNWEFVGSSVRLIKE
jgi:uncharacterized protein (TIGR02145 family)